MLAVRQGREQRDSRTGDHAWAGSFLKPCEWHQKCLGTSQGEACVLALTSALLSMTIGRNYRHWDPTLRKRIQLGDYGSGHLMHPG